MSLGANRDYKTTDRRARKNLSIHKQLMDEFIGKGFSPDEASKRAYGVMTEPTGAVDMRQYRIHQRAQSIARQFGLDPSEESFSKCVGAILYTMELPLEDDSPERQLLNDVAQKLREGL